MLAVVLLYRPFDVDWMNVVAFDDVAGIPPTYKYDNNKKYKLRYDNNHISGKSNLPSVVIPDLGTSALTMC